MSQTMRILLGAVVLLCSSYALYASCYRVGLNAQYVLSKCAVDSPVQRPDGSTFQSYEAEEYAHMEEHPPFLAPWAAKMNDALAVLVLAFSAGAIGGFLGWASDYTWSVVKRTDFDSPAFAQSLLGGFVAVFVMLAFVVGPSVLLAKATPVAWDGLKLTGFFALVGAVPLPAKERAMKKIRNLMKEPS